MGAPPCRLPRQGTALLTPQAPISHTHGHGTAQSSAPSAQGCLPAQKAVSPPQWRGKKGACPRQTVPRAGAGPGVCTDGGGLFTLLCPARSDGLWCSLPTCISPSVHALRRHLCPGPVPSLALLFPHLSLTFTEEGFSSMALPPALCRLCGFPLPSGQSWDSYAASIDRLLCPRPNLALLST